MANAQLQIDRLRRYLLLYTCTCDVHIVYTWYCCRPRKIVFEHTRLGRLTRWREMCTRPNSKLPT